LILAAFALIESVVVIRISRNYGAQPLPWFIKQALSSWLGTVLLLGPLPSVITTLTEKSVNLSILLPPQIQPTNLSSIGEEMRDHADDQHDQQHIISRRDSSPIGVSHRDWLMFASAIDRISFILYLLIFFILVVSFHI